MGKFDTFIGSLKEDHGIIPTKIYADLTLRTGVGELTITVSEKGVPGQTEPSGIVLVTVFLEREFADMVCSGEFQLEVAT